MTKEPSAEHLKQVIKDLKQKVVDLENANNQYRYLVDSTSDSLYLVDETCRYLFMNNNHLKQLKLNPQEIIGYRYDNFHSPEQSAEFSAIVKAVFSSGKSFSDEHQSILNNRYFLRTFNPVQKSGNDNQIFAVAVASKDVTERTLAEQAHLKSEEKYRLLIENSNESIFIIQNGTIKYANARFQLMLGYPPEELPNIQFIDLILDEDRHLFEIRQKSILQGDDLPLIYSFRIINRQGATRWMEANSVAITWENEPATLNFLRDVTLSKKTESRLRQAQKMEAIGTLASGIAHDFNNLLMGIQGHTSLALLQIDVQSPLYENIKTIESLVVSGAQLTKQLLGFARGGKYEVKATDLNSLIYKTTESIGRTKKEVKIHHHLSADLWPSDIDRGQIEQVLFNLYVNAFQAMPAGGDLYLTSTNVILQENRLRPPEVQTNHFAKISVSDTGAGMDEKTKERIFEPFFTTKEMGRGTGLGLATVYGIIKNHGGFINVYSEKGQGTTFNIYLPASKSKELSAPDAQTTELALGNETILFVDDEEIIIKVARELLEKLGYKIFTAKNGLSAIEIYKHSPTSVDLVVLDMVMPEMGGGEVFDELKKINPDVLVLLSSGHSQNGQAGKILGRGCAGFIQKPFTLQELAVQLRKILDARPI